MRKYTRVAKESKGLIARPFHLPCLAMAAAFTLTIAPALLPLSLSAGARVAAAAEVDDKAASKFTGKAEIKAEPVFKPDVPKLDSLEQAAANSTLKGTIEHRSAKIAPPPRKPKKLSATAAKPAENPLNGMLRAQKDKERAIKLKAQNQAFDLKEEFTIPQSIGIIGVKFFKPIDGPAVINTVFSGTPAAKAGMQVNDMIVAVDGVPTRNLSKDQCYDLIVGSPDTPITVSVMRRTNFGVKQMVRMDFNDIPDPMVRRDYLNSL